MPASTFAEILKFNPYHDARGRFTTASGGSAISSVEGEIRTQDYETLAAYGKDGNLLFRKDGNKAEVTLTAEDKQQLRGTIVTHNHPDGNRFSDDDLATFVSTGMDEMRVVTSDGMTCFIKRVDGEQQNGRDLFMDYYKLPITHESQLEEFYLKRIDRDGYSIDDEVVSSDAYYEKVRREFSANWLMENASKYGYTYSEETSTTVGKTFDYILKFNPYHDAQGRFSTSDGATLFTYAPGKSTAHDNAISRAKEAAKGFKGTLYHGSPATDIEEFDMSRAGQNTSSGEKLLYFTDSKQLAEDFSYERLEGSTKYMQRRGKKGRVYEVDVEMKNPLDLRNLSDKDVDNILKLDVEGILTREVVQELLVNHQLLKTSLDLRAESLKKLGYDGLIANTGKAGHNSIEYAVVDSKQAKIRKSIAKAFIDILKGNPWHDPSNGRFTSGPGGGSFTPATTIAEARDYAKTKLGFSGAVDFSYSYIDQKTIQQVSGTLDIDTVNHINKTITEIQEKYPELKGYVKNMVCTEANVYAKVVHSGRDATATLAIGAKNYKDGVESVNQKYLEDVDLGYHPKGTDGNAIIWHEYGHVYAATKNIDSCGQYANARAKLGAINNNVAESGWLNAATKKMMSDPKAKQECEKLGIDFTEQSVSSAFAKNISRYASKDNAELFAEAFAAENTGHGNIWTKALMEAAGA